MMIDFDRPQDPHDARFRLSEAVRRIIEELTSSSASSAEFEHARDLVEQAAAVLVEKGHERSYSGAEASLSDHQDMFFLDFSPLVGPLNPLAPPIITRAQDDGSVVGEVVFGTAYEGPPGCVHGGFIAAAFDEVCGFAMGLSGLVGMTVRLEISYRSPTPLHEEVRYEARLDRVERRKIFTTATLRHGDRLCAEATGLFVAMDPAMFVHLKQARD